jgi:hypothetical protein
LKKIKKIFLQKIIREFAKVRYFSHPVYTVINGETVLIKGTKGGAIVTPARNPARVFRIEFPLGLGVVFILGEARIGTKVFPTFLGGSVSVEPSESMRVELRIPD